MKSNTPVLQIMTASLITILAKLGGIFKVSFIIGSFAAFFSISSMLLPLTGAFGGILGSTTLFGAGILVRLAFGSVLSFKILAYHIPGYLASAYWARPSKWLSVVLPIACMVLFMAHPVGYAAAPYAMYWFIPVVIGLFGILEKTDGKKLPFVLRTLLGLSKDAAHSAVYRRISPSKNIFLHSLTSTFIAHAVGSVIWLYATPMTPEFWYALIPVVAVERLVIASGMTLAYYAFAKFFSIRFAQLQNFVVRQVRV